jgi:Immunity protein 26
VAKIKLPYSVGDWFAVPLRDGGYATGLVARMSPVGKILFGYFFGPRREAVATLVEFSRLSPKDSILIGRFGDLDLIKKNWPIIGRTEVWHPEKWPMSSFGRIEDISGQAFKVTYDQNDPSRHVMSEPCNPENIDGLPQDLLMGSGSVEIRLTKLLPRRPVGQPLS